MAGCLAKGFEMLTHGPGSREKTIYGADIILA
jgi:hypothetical protein